MCILKNTAFPMDDVHCNVRQLQRWRGGGIRSHSSTTVGMSNIDTNDTKSIFFNGNSHMDNNWVTNMICFFFKIVF